jgi:hypothetical protein
MVLKGPVSQIQHLSNGTVVSNGGIKNAATASPDCEGA